MTYVNLKTVASTYKMAYEKDGFYDHYAACNYDNIQPSYSWRMNLILKHLDATEALKHRVLQWFCVSVAIIKFQEFQSRYH